MTELKIWWHNLKHYFCHTMKAKVVDIDRVVKYDTNENLVQQLMGLSMTPSESTEEFMLNYARRCFMFDQKQVRASNINDFVEDLFKHEILLPI